MADNQNNANIENDINIIRKLLEREDQMRMYRDKTSGEAVDKLDKGLAQYSKDLRAERNKFGSWSSAFKQKTGRGFFRELSRALEYKLTKGVLKQKYPKASEAQIANEAKKIMQQTGRGLGSFAGILTKATFVLNTFSVILEGVNFALSALGERSKYYRAAIRSGAGLDDPNRLFEMSTDIMQKLRNPRIVGPVFSGSEPFKKGITQILESGTFGYKDNLETLIKSYRYIASQGILLGNSFEETSKKFIDIASIYKLTFGGKNPVQQFSFVNKAIELGIKNGFNQANVMSFYTQYAKTTAVAQRGFSTVTRDLLYGIAAIQAASGKDRDQLQQYFSALQQLTGSKMNLGAWAGLVDRRMTYSPGALEGAIKRYWSGSALTQRVTAYKNLQSETRLGGRTLLQLASEFFPGLDNEAGYTLMTKLANKDIYGKFVKGYADKNTAQQLDFLKKELSLDKETVDKLTNAAQWSELLNNPMKTIIEILQNTLRFIATMATSKVFMQGGRVLTEAEARAALTGTKSGTQIDNSFGKSLRY
jgi:hypothetical protein